MPAVSVLTPVYNGERFLRATIDSVLAQTFADFEYVIIDDGSIDGSADIVRSYDDPRIVFLQPGRLGAAGASNYGLARCQAPLIARLDADDLMEPNRLERQVAFLAERPELGGTASWCWWIDENGRLGGSHEPGLRTVAEVERHIRSGGRLIYPHPAVMFRRDPALAIGGYDSRFDSVEDVDFFVRLHEAGWPVVVQPEHLTRFRVHDSSVSATKSRRQFVLNETIFGNLDRRRRGLAPLAIEDYEARIYGSGPLARLKAEARMLAAKMMRRRVQQTLRGQPGRALASLGLAALLDPNAALRGVARSLRARDPSAEPSPR